MELKDLDDKLKYMGFFSVKFALLLNVFSFGYLVLFQEFKTFLILSVLSLIFHWLAYVLGITKKDYIEILKN